jgi:hypothetical protein
MQSKLTEITYEVELRAGEALTLTKEAAEIVGPGNWRISIRPAEHAAANQPVRDHTAFLNSYAPEDEGLYDDCSAG